MAGESVQSLDRALSILTVLSKTEGHQGVTRLAVELGLAKSTVHRLLATLERAGFVTRTPEGRYGLGIRLWEIGCAAVPSVGVRDAARPVMQRLASQTGETVKLSVWDKAEAVFIERVDGTAPPGPLPHIGARVPAHASASGLILLAYQDQETQAAVCSNIERLTEKTVTDSAQLRKRLDDIRRQGHAISHAAWYPGCAAVAAPIRSQNGSVVAALSISAPAERLTPRAGQLGREVRTAADEVSRALGDGGRNA